MTAVSGETRGTPPLSTLQPPTSRIGQFWPAPPIVGRATSTANGPSPATASAVSSREDLLKKGFDALRAYELAPDRGAAQLSRAETFFKSALRLVAGEPRAIIGIATVHLHRGEFAPALPLLRDALKRASAGITPETQLEASRTKALGQLRQLLAYCFSGLGRHSSMRDALVGVTDIDPANVEALCALALIDGKVAQDGVGQSMEYLDQAVQVKKDHPVVLCQLANHAFYCGQADRDSNGHSNGGPNGHSDESWHMASSLIQPATASDRSSPVRAEAHFQLGRLQHAKGQYAEAYEEYSKSKLLQPDNLANLFFLAQTCIQQRKFEEAVKHLEAVRSRLSKEPIVLKLLTFAYLSVGNKATEAAKCAETLVNLNKEDLESWGMRAEACDQLVAQDPKDTARKDSADAYEQFAKLLTSKDGNPAAKEMETPQAWNNIGTLRSLQGDAAGAQAAYDKGIELADKLLNSENRLDNEDLKDLRISRLTIRFNRAWLVESMEQPNYLKAAQDYLAIREEHNWYADSLLRVGYLWRRMGDTDRAMSTYDEARQHCPVLAGLMTADTYRQTGNYTKAIEVADAALRRSTQKQKHYLAVFIGNLCYEAAHLEKSNSTKEKFMTKALQHFTKALADEKDSHYAANGIGLIFAEREKYDFAKRTFQSVMQHNAMGDDPSIYINLAHTYVKQKGENVRRAISLYERAKKIRPNDLSIRLYLAKSHFELKEFERCTGILSDALLVWPDDLLLRYNLAISLENFGVHLVAAEKKSKRVVGIDTGVEQMKRAVDLLSSANRMYDYVKNRWSEMSSDEKRASAKESGVSSFSEEMARVGLHSQYCERITEDAKVELERLDSQRGDLDEKMAQILREKDLAKAQEQEQEQERQAAELEVHREMQEDALRLMESGTGIDLGKDLAAQFDAQKKGQPARPRKEKTPKFSADVQVRMVECTDCAGSGFAPLPEGVEDPQEGVEREQCKACEGGGKVPAANQARPKGGGRKPRKSKKDKKEKKERKKEKKRLREERGGGSSEGEGDGRQQDKPARDDDVEALFGPSEEERDKDAEDRTGAEKPPSGGESDAERGKKRKKDKKEKKEKKKDKKHKKRDRSDSDGDGTTPQEDKQMEEEFFTMLGT